MIQLNKIPTKVKYIFKQSVVYTKTERQQKKNKTLAQVLSCELCKISKNTFFTEKRVSGASVVL